MRVLIANKFWYSRGGQERVAIDEARWLKEAGHDVAHFAAAHPSNEASAWAEYFSPYLELGEANRPDLISQAVAVQRLFSNRAARKQFDRILQDFKPDVIHIHGIARQISSSILGPALAREIPVVQTMHDYHHVCASGDLMRGGNEICLPPKCGAINIAPAVCHKCRQSSRAVSLLLGLETAWARSTRIYERAVVRYVSPSRFLADVVRAAGWTEHAIDIIPNASDMQGHGDAGQSELRVTEGFVFAGRLSREKGVLTLVKASELAGVKLRIAGEGPLESEVSSAASAAVTLLGWLSAAEVEETIRGSVAAVLPSEWLENLPMGVIEAMAIGVPVIASRVGGIPEILRDGIDGILFEPGDVDALAQAMKLLAENPELASRMGSAAAERARTVFGKDEHIARLLDTYQLAINRVTS